MIAGLPGMDSLEIGSSFRVCSRVGAAGAYPSNGSLGTHGGEVNSTQYPRTRTFGYKLGSRFAALTLSAVIAACGGGGDDQAALGTNPPSNPPANQSPTISGTPASQVMQNTAYSFMPTASDPDGNALTFSITNKPSWATFNTATGALTGTPAPQNVGSTANIQITVSDGTATASLTSFSINVVASASGAATLAWTAPMQNTDGSALTDLANYKIYWGTSQGNYTNSKVVASSAGTTSIVDQLTPATYFFVVTALDTGGNE